jgi:hypothetical protein
MRFLFLFSFICLSYSLDEISWTLSKPPANLFRWKTSKQTPSYTVPSLSSGNFVLQALAIDASGTTTHSGTLQGVINDQTQSAQVVLNPLITADAVRYQQPSYVKWVKTNKAVAFAGDTIILTILGESNPPNSDMKFTVNQQLKCTTKNQCVTNKEHTLSIFQSLEWATLYQSILK